VYLARSVTGMYRAVKVVRREDFEFERTFEREFEGIQHYEKVSQDHPGLVDVLHVGRNNGAGYYYYVMELADEEGGDHEVIDVTTYKPRTLASDLRRKPIRSVRECVDLGMSMAGALGHLHHAGLTHRDVKPSNIIYVKGQPKLADVGLVASTGQRTFVGTEGYVPPEGPGTSSADLYSLAMVLYEMHTGKDRLDFPELPTNLEIPPTVNRDEWRALNGIICRGGSPDPRKRFESAHALAKALRGVCQDLNRPEERERKSPLAALLGTFVILALTGIIAGGGNWLWRDNQSFFGKHGETIASVERNGKGLNDPSGQPLKPIEEIVVEEGAVLTPDREGKGKGFSFIDPVSGDSVEKGEVVFRDEVTKPADPEVVDPPEKTGPELVANPVEDPTPQGRVKIMSQPPAATVVFEGAEIGITETKLIEFNVGPIELTLKRPGFHDAVYRGEVREGTQVISLTLLPDLGPVPGTPWMNSLGVEFVPGLDGVLASRSEITVEVFDRFLTETGLEIPTVGVGGIVQVPEERAVWDFCDWMTEKDRASGHLGPDRYYRPERSPLDSLKKSFTCSIRDQFGTLVLNTEPPGAKIFQNGLYLDETPAVVNDLRLGAFELQLVKPGFEVAVAMGDLSGTEPKDLVVELERDNSVVFGAPWVNSEGMEMVPFENLLVASRETSVRAYRDYLTSQGIAVEISPEDFAILDQPASGISFDEANAFCEWLTNTERAAGFIRPWQRYRLPADVEWSRFAGLRGETGQTPEARNSTSGNSFPWGTDWPPPAGAGNFADAASSVYFGTNVIEGYTDGFQGTAPVGSFSPNASGLYDISGNVWEWVLDPYTDGSDGLRVVRGGGWNSADPEVLATAYRNPVPAASKESFYGFRYVLEDTGSPD
jgi:eukaryotic-like serine/threonine-protein kinase